MSFALPWVLLLLPLPIAGFVIWVVAMRRGRARAASLSRIPPATPPYASATLITLAMLAAIVAAAQPRWGSEPMELDRTGADILFVLDVSRGMAARDLEPSRLEAARSGIETTLDGLQGDRAGLIIFGGTASLRFPLTNDFAASRNVLQATEAGSIFVDPGTDIAAGLTLATEVLRPGGSRAQLIVLLSDGEHLGQGDPREAASAIGAAGIDLLVVGVGTAEGGMVPVFDLVEGGESDLRDEAGDPVISRLDEETLVAVARAAGGRYLGADPAMLAGAVQGRIQALEQRRSATEISEIPTERFQWFVAGAAGLLAMAVLFDRVPALRRVRTFPATSAIVVALVAAGCAEGSHEINQQGIEAFEHGDYAAAAEHFQEAALASPDDLQIHLNRAAALHADGDYNGAMVAARRSIASVHPGIRAAAYSSVGHSAFALGDLPAALDAFKNALREEPLAEYRHNYEVVLRLVDEVEQDESTPTAEPGDDGNGGENEGDGEPGGEEPAEGQAGGEPGGGDPALGSGGGSTPQSLTEADDAIAEIDEAIENLRPDEGEAVTATEAREILNMLAERARLAALRESLSGGRVSPDDF